MLCFSICSIRANAQLTAFSYPGKLASSINGSYDFKFTLYNAASAGNPIGTPVTITSVTVTNGIYTAAGIDFGANSFTTAPLYLAISYRQSGSSGSWSNVSGRVLLTARFSIVAQNAQNALAIGGGPVSGSAPSTGQVLQWSGSAWGPGNLPVYAAGAGLSLTGSIFSIASGGVVASMLANNSVTTSAIADGAVTVAKLGWPLSESFSSGGPLLSLSNSGGGEGGYFYSSSGIGVYGSSSSDIGVYGYSASNTNAAGYFNNGGSGYGVSGYSSNAGVYGQSSYGLGVYGNSSNGTGVYGSGGSYGGYFTSSYGGGYGVYGSSSSGAGVFGYSSGAGAAGYFTNGGTGDGVDSFGSSSSTGVYGSSSSGAGLYGYSNSGYGVIGYSQNYYSGWFNGSIQVSGAVYAGTKDFRIDHPLDPANKYLLHSCVESDQMKTFYDGHVTTDANGSATVTLPDWFEALNKDFEYHLTVIGQFAQAIISHEIQNHQFSIQTDKPYVKVSWQVTGVRQDAYALAHPLVVEQEKPEKERGKYLFPTESGVDETLGIDYELTHRHK